MGIISICVEGQQNSNGDTPSTSPSASSGGIYSLKGQFVPSLWVIHVMSET